MALYRTCVGCAREKQACGVRESLRAHLKGIGVTSIKWRCRERDPRFKRGMLIWALTVDGSGEFNDGEPIRDYFPAVAIEARGSKMLVYIEEGARGRDDDTVTFKSNANGFCKIPLGRLELREGSPVEVCPSCDWPASKGHQQGWSCSVARPKDNPEDQAPF